MVKICMTKKILLTNQVERFLLRGLCVQGCLFFNFIGMGGEVLGSGKKIGVLGLF